MAQGNNLLMFFVTGQRISLEYIAQANETLANADGEASELVVIDSRTELCFPLHQAATDQALGTPARVTKSSHRKTCPVS